MQTVSLTWQQAAELGGGLAVLGAGLRAVPRRRVRAVAPFFVETAILALLYAMWQLAGEWSVAGAAGAFRRAHTIMRVEQDVGMPSEHDVQHLVLGHRLLVEAANLYYATMHFTTMLVFLVWLFVRHRDRYRPVRATLAWTTLACLVIQLMPVAPPRLLPGFVDTGLTYNQSVYDRGLEVDQLSAMPSVHVAWAMLVGWYAVRVTRSRWRWLAALHAAVTAFVVVATANHWWLDGIVATAALVVCAWLRVAGSGAARAALARWRRSRPGPPTPRSPEPVTAVQ